LIGAISRPFSSVQSSPKWTGVVKNLPSSKAPPSSTAGQQRRHRILVSGEGRYVVFGAAVKAEDAPKFLLAFRLQVLRQAGWHGAKGKCARESKCRRRTPAINEGHVVRVPILRARTGATVRAQPQCH
jgi:hypothetical protein